MPISNKIRQGLLEWYKATISCYDSHDSMLYLVVSGSNPVHSFYSLINNESILLNYKKVLPVTYQEKPIYIKLKIK